MMSKQALLECTLDMWLTQRQIDCIKKDWGAFYADPIKFRGTVVVDMVREYLGMGVAV